MSFLLDTCLISKLRKIRSHPDPKLLNWLGKHPDSLYFISAITVGEIQTGIAQIDVSSKSNKQHQAILREWFFGELLPKFQDRILDIDSKVALTWGQMVGRCRLNGRMPPVSDSLIAATALHHGLVVATENVKDFEPTGVETLNPYTLT